MKRLLILLEQNQIQNLIGTFSHVYVREGIWIIENSLSLILLKQLHPKCYFVCLCNVKFILSLYIFGKKKKNKNKKFKSLDF